MPETEDKKLNLAKAHLKGFKSIEALEVELKPGLNILIGPNGSGKSNLFEFLDGAFERVLGGGIEFTSIVLEYACKGDKLRFSLENDLQNANQLNGAYLTKIFIGESLVSDSSDPFFEITLEKDSMFHEFIEKISYPRPGRIANKPNVLKHLLQPLLVNFNIPEEIEFITKPGNITINGSTMQWTTSLGYVNDMFSSISSSAIVRDSVSARRAILSGIDISEVLTSNLALFTPIKDLRLNEAFGVYRTDRGTYIDNLRLDFLVNGNWVPWSYLSDGTKRLFYIVAEVSYKKDGLILIEEPELGVHPYQFHLLMQFMKEQSAEKQIVISTHSPKALDILEPGEMDRIMIARYDKKKGTQISRMTAKQKRKAKDYMKDMFLSDYWLMSDLEEHD